MEYAYAGDYRNAHDSPWFARCRRHDRPRLRRPGLTPRLRAVPVTDGSVQQDIVTPAHGAPRSPAVLAVKARRPLPLTCCDLLPAVSRPPRDGPGWIGAVIMTLSDLAIRKEMAMAPIFTIRNWLLFSLLWAAFVGYLAWSGWPRLPFDSGNDVLDASIAAGGNPRPRAGASRVGRGAAARHAGDRPASQSVKGQVRIAGGELAWKYSSTPMPVR